MQDRTSICPRFWGEPERDEFEEELDMMRAPTSCQDKDTNPTLLRFLSSSLLLSLTLLVGCDSGPKISDQNLIEIQANEVARMLAEGQDGHIALDPRTRLRYDSGHLPAALHIPLESLKARDPRLLGHDTLIVYGTDWNDLVPQAAGKKLLSLGYESVRVYRGGVADWVTNGGKIEHTTP